MDIYVSSQEEALAKCLELQNKGEVDLFRGQTHDWTKISPSLFRLCGDERLQAESKLHNFLEWASYVPQMNQYQDTIENLIAIAQHYGIPTTFLDLTTSPEIALLFSKINKELVDSKSESIIYCFSTSVLSKISNGRLININVDNLWRLETQAGLFLEFLDNSLDIKLREMAIRIHYPSVKLEKAEYELIYPSQKSHLETIIEQWFYRHTIETTLESLDIPIQIKINRNRSYPGIFKWRQLPIQPKEWTNDNWIKKSPIENFANIQATTHNEICISLLQFSTSKDLVDFISNLIKKPIKDYCENKINLLFSININEIERIVNQKISKLINRCWDGIRVLPYDSNEMINCIALTLSLTIGRALKIEDINDWIKQLYGDIEYLEVAPIGGHISDGFVSKKSLSGAFSNKFHHNLTKYFHNKIKKTPNYIMNWILEPWLIFDFSIFKKVYVEQFIPTSIDHYWESELNEYYDGKLISESMFSTSFNPALLGYVTNVDYRMHSPIANEIDPAHTIYITPDMIKSDIEELFIYCLLHISNKGNPYQVKFTDYEYDPREIWEISHVIDQCKWIIEISGISVLEVMIDKKDDFSPHGLGALDIWVIANKLTEKQNKIDENKGKQYFQEFWKQLMFSNKDLKNRMNNWIEEEKKYRKHRC